MCQVPPERYMEAVTAMQPDMFVALADEVWKATAMRVTVLPATTSQAACTA